MDAEDRELFQRSLAHVMSSASGPALDEALIDLGWHEALASDPSDAVALAFEQQGRAGATSAALGVLSKELMSVWLTPTLQPRRFMMCSAPSAASAFSAATTYSLCTRPLAY